MIITSNTPETTSANSAQPNMTETRSVFRDVDGDMLEGFRAHAAIDDRNNRFFDETHAELVASGYCTANLPVAFGGG